LVTEALLTGDCSSEDSLAMDKLLTALCLLAILKMGCAGLGEVEISSFAVCGTVCGSTAGDWITLAIGRIAYPSDGELAVISSLAVTGPP
jgi:hypothetical protein